jgi:hypothetical protein
MREGPQRMGPSGKAANLPGGISCAFSKVPV